MTGLPELRRAQNLRDVRNWLGLSLGEMAARIPKTRGGKNEHVSRAFICLVQRGARNFLPQQMEALVQMLQEQLADEMRRDDFAVHVTTRSKWHVKVTAKCVKCGKWFEMKRATSRRCARCARRE